jgi:hypothetical protein
MNSAMWRNGMKTKFKAIATLRVPTYYGDRPGKEEFDTPRVPIVFSDAAGARLVLGTRDPNEMGYPDVQVERRPGGWAVFINDSAGDVVAHVYIIDNGKVYLHPEYYSSTVILDPKGEAPQELDNP